MIERFGGFTLWGIIYVVFIIAATYVSVKIHDDTFNFGNCFFLAWPFGPFYILFALMSPTNWAKVFGTK